MAFFIARAHISETGTSRALARWPYTTRENAWAGPRLQIPSLDAIRRRIPQGTWLLVEATSAEAAMTKLDQRLAALDPVLSSEHPQQWRG